MKSLIKSILLLALLLPATAIAHDFEVDGIYYNYCADGSTVEVTISPDLYSGDVTIPSTVTYNGTNYSVTSIGSNAFAACDSLTSVTIPNSVITIGNYAFASSRGLTSITIPSSVTSIGLCAFLYCTGLSNLTIPGTVTTIGETAFGSCYGLTSVTIGNGVTTIGNAAFAGCATLTSLTIPASVSSIGRQVFSSCDNLTSLTVVSENSTFDSRDYCNAIIETASNTLVAGCKGTVIPNTVMAIGNSAFYECHGLTSITIPNSVTVIDNSAFLLCNDLTSVTIPNSVITLGENAFGSCRGLTSVNIGNSVTTIGKQAFSYCYNLTDVTIPNSVITIGEEAFDNCRAMTSLTIGNSVTTIARQAFFGCIGLTNVTIPNSVTTIGEEAFANCTNLTNLTLGNSVTTIGKNVFENCINLTSLTIPASVQSIELGIFTSCYNLSSLVVESGNTTYDSRDNCNAIIETATNTLIAGCQNTIIPNSITAIGDYAFTGCINLTSVVIPGSVTSIGGRAFMGCTNLASLTIPNSVITIGYLAFQNTAWLQNQPEGIVYAGLVAYTYNGLMPESIILRDGTLGIADYAFSWEQTLKSVTIPNSLKVIGFGAFYACSNLADMTIPSSVTTIGELAFYSCKSLASVTIPSSVTSIGAGPFSGCDNLTSLTVESGNTTYDSRDNCNAIIETATNTLIGGCPKTIIPNTVTAIGEIAFYFFDRVVTVIIPSSVTSIGEEAFMYCGGLKSVTIPNSVRFIDSDAFTSCWSLTDVYSYITDPSSVSYGYSIFRVLGNFDYSARTLHVLPGKAAAYQAHNHWYPYFVQIVEDLIPDFKRGDVNLDGEVNIADVNALIDIIMGGNGDTINADVNGDGEIGIADINTIINIILGAGASMPDYHEYVDLGLPSGTLWATVNVGANNPEDFGDYFAWGETSPKQNYNWNSYKWCRGNYNKLTKYNNNSSYGIVDGKRELVPDDDAAYANWGPWWRMPTADQQFELINMCSWEKTTRNGVNGRLITGPNGNSIFLPASGYADSSSSLKAVGSIGFYWSRTIDDSDTHWAHIIRLFDSEVDGGYGYRCNGYAVRAVRVSSK